MRFSIVCYLDSQTHEEVRSIQEELGDLTGARASLDLWKPHITVGDGIEIEENELSSIKLALSSITKNTQPFIVEMHDIIKMDVRKGGKGETTTPYGLYLAVEKSEALLTLVKGISKTTEGINKWYHMPRPYHPHCALAFKDLDKEGFEAGAKFLDSKHLALKAEIDHIALVEMLPAKTRESLRLNFPL